MFGISGFELVIILIFGFLIFGPDKLPAIAKTAAQAINKFRSAQEEMTKVIRTEVYDPNSDEPFKNPLDALAKVTGGEKKEEKTESFSERKAKYDKERAAKKAAEDKKEVKSSTVAAGGVAAKVVNDESKVEAKASEGASKPKPTADELYGNKPLAKPAAKPEAAKPTTTEAVTSTKPTATTKPTTKAAATKPASTKAATVTVSDAKAEAKKKSIPAAKPVAASGTAKTATKSTVGKSAANRPAPKPASTTKSKTNEKGE